MNKQNQVIVNMACEIPPASETPAIPHLNK